MEIDDVKNSMINSKKNLSSDHHKIDRINEVKALIESVPKSENQIRPLLDEKQEKIKKILREAYTDVRLAQSKIIEKVNEVMYLTERTEALKKELTNSFVSASEKNFQTNTSSDNHTSSHKNTDHIMFFDKLLATQENIDLLLMDSIFESLNTVDVIDSIQNSKLKFSQSLRAKSESLNQLESERGKWSLDVLTKSKDSSSGNFAGLMKISNKKFGSSNDVSQNDEQFFSMNNSFRSSFNFPSTENFKITMDSYCVDKFNALPKKLVRSESLNSIYSNIKFDRSCYSLNGSEKLIKRREWASSDFNLNKNSPESKCNLSDDDYYSICSSLKANSMAYSKTIQFDSYLSLNSSENTSGFHSYSNLKSQDQGENTNETFCLENEPSGMVTSTAKKSRDSDCVRRNNLRINEITSFLNVSDVEVARNNFIETERTSKKFREINIFSGFFVLFVYFDLKIFLFFVAIFNWIKNLFSRK